MPVSGCSEITAQVRLPEVSRLGVNSRHERRTETPLAVDRGPADRAADDVRPVVRAGLLDQESFKVRLKARLGSLSANAEGKF